MSSGAKVVIAMFGAVGAIAVLAVAAFLLTDEGGVRCVEGEAQDNAVRADGSVLPRVETFETLAEAESFVCRHIPRPRDTRDMALREARVARERNLGDTIEGEGGADIELVYDRDGEDFTLAVAIPATPLPSGSQGELITVQEQQGLLTHSPGAGVTVRWNKGGFSFAGAAELDEEFELEDLLSVLESVH